MKAGVVAIRLPEAPPKFREYVPFWASSGLLTGAIIGGLYLIGNPLRASDEYVTFY